MLDLVEPRENLAARSATAARAARDDRGRPRRRAGAPLTAAARGRGRSAGRATPRSLRGARPVGRRAARAQLDAPAHARLRRLRLRRLPGAARRPRFRDDPAIVGGLARLGELDGDADRPPEGPHHGEMMERNFGMPEPEGYRKALRLMRYAEQLRHCRSSRFVDTPGAYPGPRRRGARPVDRDRRVDHAPMSRLPVPIVTVVTGEGGSGGALALAASDRVHDAGELLLLGDQPRGLRDDPVQGRRRGAAGRRALRITAPDLLRLEIMDAVVPSPPRARTPTTRRPPPTSRRRSSTACSELLRLPTDRAARATLRPVPHVWRPRSAARTSADCIGGT